MLSNLFALLQRVVGLITNYLLYRAGHVDAMNEQFEQSNATRAAHQAAVDTVDALPDSAVREQLQHRWTRD